MATTFTSSDAEDAVRELAVDIFKKNGCDVKEITYKELEVTCPGGQGRVRVHFEELWAKAGTSTEFGLKMGEFDFTGGDMDEKTKCFAIGVLDTNCGMLSLDIVESEPIQNYIRGSPKKYYPSSGASIPLKAIHPLRRFPCPWLPKDEARRLVPTLEFIEKMESMKKK